ncbi:MAG: threonine synthase [Verrucomicrobiota bacterium]|nr:threonine synthase [Limisphaera sp.]MDW8382409.1 threonine synthase [Verrucomicrobiota bacterium]
MIRYFSTNGRAPIVALPEALWRGQAPDRGLYLPERFPVLDRSTRASFASLEYPSIATQVLAPYIAGTFSQDELEKICRESYDFAVPLEPVRHRPGVWVLRLDGGPTASFKDFAARWMARVLGRLVAQKGESLVILTATSGDTGSAVANAFHRVPGIRVVVLFPHREVSDRQRRQMTTLGDNIRTVAVQGKFDDCQALVKRAFADPLLQRFPLSSANSINIGRLLPQCVYYFYAASRVAGPDEPVVVVVPSGNFGNMMGAVLAWRMGLPVRRLVVPVNENDEFPRYLATGRYEKVEPARACLSNAMNVGHPSNLARLVAVYGGWMDETGHVHRAPDLAAMRRDLFSVAASDDQTRAAMQEAWHGHALLLEPHGAVAWHGLRQYQQAENISEAPVILLETAHPAKFPEEIEQLLGFRPSEPPSLRGLEQLPESYDILEPRYESFRDYLIAHLSS